VAHPDVKRISFTGSVETAKKIGSSAAKNLTPVSFELGGKSPLIVCDDADMDLAVENMLEQYDNAGQVCLAGTRLLIQENVAPMLLERMKEGVKKLKLGDPRDHSTKVGPLIHPEHLKRVDGFVKRAIAAGAELVYGGKVSESLGGLYYEPTLFINAKPGSEILTQEVFGPVLTFQTFKTDEEAIELANNTDYGLAATIFTKNEKRAERLSSAISAGLVWVNCFYVRDLAQPFGGMKRSGIGREGGHWSFDFYCDIKNVAHRIGTLM
jgi:aminomuconate-semialdehyde/2-hydroxymuconate-6-semialdehyde dehydrogenase